MITFLMRILNTLYKHLLIIFNITKLHPLTYTHKEVSGKISKYLLVNKLQGCSKSAFYSFIEAGLIVTVTQFLFFNTPSFAKRWISSLVKLL